MTAPQPARIFISYATEDGAEYAAKLRRELEANGFSIWQDIVALQGNADWWTQIENALRSNELQHFILVLTPGALASSTVRQEIRLAKQEGKTVLPVRGPGIDDMARMPRWLGNLYDLDVPERRRNLLRLLELPSTAKRVPIMAPEPPADFVARPTEFKALKDQLLHPDTKDAVAITAALRGAGGYGKTTLAKALAHDSDIQDAYFDGILWVELGEKGGGRVTTLINDLVALITGASPQITTIEAARTVLAEALGDRRILLIIDDVWQKHHLDPFLHGGKRTTRLVTTRFDKELPDTAIRQKVDAMQPAEARALLEWGLPKEQATSQAHELGELSTKLHDWAQLLKLANGFLRDRVVKYRQALDAAIAEAGERLVIKGLPAFDDPKANDYEGRHKSVAAAVGINLDLLDEHKRDRFGELGIFPEDADIPVGIVARLWAGDGNPDHFATVDLLTELCDLSLLLSLDLDRRTIRLHDTTRQFLQDEAKRKGQLVAQHKRLLQAIGDIGGATDAPAADKDYFYRYRPLHLAEAGDRETLQSLLLDPGWLQAKLNATGNPQHLIDDYRNYGHGSAEHLIGQALGLSAGILARDRRQLIPQLLGRLMPQDADGLDAVLKAAWHHLPTPAIVPTSRSLTPPGGENSRLEGHPDWVRSLALLLDGRLASAADDGTVRVWDLKSVSETARLEGHGGAVNALTPLLDGRLASGSDDKTIRLWDVMRCVEVGRLEGHSGGVKALALLADGRIASGSDDKTVRLWDLARGTETARLEGHGGSIWALALLADGRLASGSDDKTIRLWDLARCTETACLEGHGGAVYALAPLIDGRLASGSDDNTICLWNLARGAETVRLEGPQAWIDTLAVLADGRLASAGGESTIRLWDLATRAEVAGLQKHWGPVSALTALPDARLASAGADGTIWLWDLAHGAETARLHSHQGWVRALALLPNGRVASAGADESIRVWDCKSGVEVARLKGHQGWVRALATLPDGRLASAGADRTIRLWDINGSFEIARLEGHQGWVRALATLADGRLASGGADNAIRVWDVNVGVETARLEGHRGWISALTALPDGRLASTGADKTIRLWDIKSKVETACLEGHQGWISGLLLMPDGRLASASDDRTIRLWELGTCTESACLTNHNGPVIALALLPDGRLASGGRDKTVRLWDPKCDAEVTRIEVDAAVTCLAVLDGGRKILAGDTFGSLHWLEVLS